MARPAFWAPIFAWFRQGSKEFAQALPALPGSIRVVEEPGTLGNPTQQIVTEQSGALNDLMDKYDSRRHDYGDHGRGIER